MNHIDVRGNSRFDAVNSLRRKSEMGLGGRPENLEQQVTISRVQWVGTLRRPQKDSDVLLEGIESFDKAACASLI